MAHPDQILGEDLPSVQTEYWINPNFEPHKIGRWPANGSVRAETRFRNFKGQHEFPIATRYLINLVAIDGFPPFPLPDLDIWAWLDLVDGTEDDFEGATAPSPTVPRCEFQIRHVEVLPTLLVPGVHMTAKWFNASGFVTFGYEWKDEGEITFIARINTLDMPPDTRTQSAIDFGYDSLSCEVFAMSECYDFPCEPSRQGGAARFNGTDSYIQLTNNIPQLSVPFIISADIRLHDHTSFWPLFGFNNQGGFTGMDEDDVIFGFLRIATVWVPVLDVWFNWRFEFEQVLQLNYRTFIDDVQVDESTFGRQFSQRDTIGVFRHGIPDTIWANMDVKNLKLLTGSVPSSDVALDMPLEVDAQDNGPLENHGEAFNIDFGCP